MQQYQFERIYSQLEKALLMAFDSYTNAEVMNLIDSIDTWEKRM